MLYLFANRRSENTGIEQLFAFEPGELEAIDRQRQSFPAALSDSLHIIGLHKFSRDLLQSSESGSAARLFSQWLSATAILLQQCTGHQVGQVE